MVRLQIDAAEPDPIVLERASAVLRGGGIAVIPTDTLYGLAADPFNASAVARIFAIKGRGAAQALPLIAADLAQVVSALGALTSSAMKLAERYWPGPLTLLVAAPARLTPAVSAGTGRVGIRVPRHLVAMSLCRLCGTPLTATSANISGEPASEHPDAVARGLAALTDAVDLMIDAGDTPGGPASTIVDVDEGEIRLVRAGPIRFEELQACLRG